MVVAQGAAVRIPEVVPVAAAGQGAVANSHPAARVVAQASWAGPHERGSSVARAAVRIHLAEQVGEVEEGPASGSRHLPDPRCHRVG